MRKMERIYHTWDKWESFYHGFFDNNPPTGISKKQAERLYYELLSDPAEFSHVLERVIEEWPYSCEHNLTNKTLNRIAWMGQAALAYKYKIPAQFRGGYNLLTKQQQRTADDVALKYINVWLARQGYPSIEYDAAEAVDVKQALY
jgi:hypothetical protein